MKFFIWDLPGMNNGYSSTGNNTSESCSFMYTLTIPNFQATYFCGRSLPDGCNPGPPPDVYPPLSPVLYLLTQKEYNDAFLR